MIRSAELALGSLEEAAKGHERTRQPTYRRTMRDLSGSLRLIASSGSIAASGWPVRMACSKGAEEGTHGPPSLRRSTTAVPEAMSLSIRRSR